MHKSVLLAESIKALHVKNQGHYVDATLGAGGHTVEILRRGGCVIGIDVDTQMLKVAKERVYKACPTLKENLEGCLTLLPGNFSDIDKLVRSAGLVEVDGIIADLGLSMYHYKADTRGFSFSRPADSLDMRLNSDLQAVKASDLLNSLPEKQLVKLFVWGMNESVARKLARGVIRARDENPITYVSDFLRIIEATVTKRKTHPATQAFMALRMAVNNELDNLKDLIDKSIRILVSRGRLVIITFHSKEDAYVVKLFRSLERQGLVTVVQEDEAKPSSDEVRGNKSARSARLRVIEKA